MSQCITYSTYTIDCKTQHCQHTHIDCITNEDCFVLCDEPESCLSATITCPLQGNCNILCEGGESCRDTIINATLQLGNLNLECKQSSDHCRDIKVYGSILDPVNNDFSMNISCNGQQRSCANSHIICPMNSNCIISCSSDTSCRWSQIIGPINGNLNIKCLGINSCFDSIFDGSQSQIFSINGCVADKSCLDLTFYCPPNTNGYKNCFIEGNNNIGRDNANGINIYAINGWNDIHINYYGTYTASHSGTMFCGNDYGITCEIAHNDWSCSNKNDYCNFYSDTIITTPYPTLYEIINMEQDKNNYKYETVLWTKDIIIGLILMAIAVVLCIIAIHCCCSVHKHLKTSRTKSKKRQIDKQKSELIIRTITGNVNTKLQTNYQCIDICDNYNDKLNDDDLKEKILDDIENTIKYLNMRHAEGVLDPYSAKDNNILGIEAMKIVKTGIYGTGSSMSNICMNSDANSMTQIENATPHIMDNKIIESIIPEELRKESNTVTNTVSTNAGNASSNDINERNILFLNPPTDTLHVDINKRKITNTQSNETSVSIQTDYDESSLSYDMYASPVKPHILNN